MSSFFFDASTVAPQASSTPIPAGTYLAYITDSSIAATKTGNGQILKLTFEVLDGTFKGRKVFENLNIQNANPETQRIAQSQLSAICHVTGVIQLQQTEALHFKPMKIKVGIDEAKNGYDARNRIKGYETSKGAAPVAAGIAAPAVPAAMPAQMSAAPAANAAAAPAWARKAA